MQFIELVILKMILTFKLGHAGIKRIIKTFKIIVLYFNDNDKSIWISCVSKE